jgi:hypothetical protein
MLSQNAFYKCARGAFPLRPTDVNNIYPIKICWLFSEEGVRVNVAFDRQQQSFNRDLLTAS